MGLRIVATRAGGWVSATAVATVEKPAPGRPWRFLLIAVLEHGGFASAEELCAHLFGAPRHPLIERLLSEAEKFGDLEKIDDHWWLSESVREALREGAGRVKETAEFEFRISTLTQEVFEVVSAAGQLSKDHSTQMADRPIAPQNIRQAIDRVCKTEFRPNFWVESVDDPILVGEESERLTDQVPIDASEVDLPSLLVEALPTGFAWNPDTGCAESSLRSGIEFGAVRDDSITSVSLDRFVLRSGEEIRNVRVTGIPWCAVPDAESPHGEVSSQALETDVALAKKLLALQGVPTDSECRRLERDLSSRDGDLRDVATFAQHFGLAKQAGWVLAAWDWDL